MPTYEYKCSGCGKRFEKRQNFSDAPLTLHEECGSHEVERLISVPALQFKGTGFYITDYAKGSGAGSKTDGKPPAASKEGGNSDSKKSSDNSGSSSSTKSDSAPASSNSGSSSSSGSSDSSSKPSSSSSGSDSK